MSIFQSRITKSSFVKIIRVKHESYNYCWYTAPPSFSEIWKKKLFPFQPQPPSNPVLATQRRRQRLGTTFIHSNWPYMLSLIPHKKPLTIWKYENLIYHDKKCRRVCVFVCWTKKKGFTYCFMRKFPSSSSSLLGLFSLCSLYKHFSTLSQLPVFVCVIFYYNLSKAKEISFWESFPAFFLSNKKWRKVIEGGGRIIHSGRGGGWVVCQNVIFPIFLCSFYD